MRYRREDPEGDYVFGSGDNHFLTNSPEAIAQAVKTRFELWQGEWFLDDREGTPYKQEILGKHQSPIYQLAIRERILTTQGVTEIEALEIQFDTGSRRIAFTATINTLYGKITVNSEA